MYIVQLYKEDWQILHMLGCLAIALPSTEQIVSVFWLYKPQYFWSKIIQILSLNKLRAEEVPVVGIENIYIFHKVI